MIRKEWHALGKLVGLLLQISLGYVALISLIATLEMLGL